MTFIGLSGPIGGTELLGGGAFTMAVAIAGVTVGMSVAVTPRTFPGNGIDWEGYVSAPGVVTIKVGTTIALFVTASLYDVQVNDVAGGPPQIQTVTATFTAAQLNGMSVTPLMMVPAQGPGTLLRVAAWTANAVGPTPFTGGGPLQVVYNLTAAASSTTPATILTALASGNLTSGGTGAMGVSVDSFTLNNPLALSNQTAPFAAGAGSTLTISLQYYVLTGLQ